jgi:hypothetical protein
MPVEDQLANETLSDYVPSSNRAYYYRARAALKAAGRPAVCENDGCDMVYDLQVHHKDEDITNNDPENLKYLCVDCHSMEHPDRDSLILSEGGRK